VIVFIGFLPSFQVDGVEWGCLYTSKHGISLSSLAKCRYVLIDQGIGAAVRREDTFAWYIRALNRVKAVAPSAKIRVVVPDAFGDMETTRRLYWQFVKRMGRLLDGVEKVLVLQQPQKVHLWVKTEEYRDADVVAVPAKMAALEGGHVPCHKKPELCARLVKDVLLNVDRPVHALGPAKRVLLELKERGYLWKLDSFDTLRYRMAPSKRARIKAEEGEPGKYMVVRGREELFLKEWLRGIFEIRE